MTVEYLDVHPEVAAALSEGRAVVALESTIISHGMPYPQNVETARRVEATVRAGGAVPATIAVLNGRLKAGLTPEELEHLGRARDVVKTSRRDIPVVVAKNLTGATTVAATMIIADLAGIRVFVTGGIGGVHRDARQSFDISADLSELARTDVAVVCAGVKSILDIGATLEYLETCGVPVFGYQTNAFPAFYTRRSGFEVEIEARTTLEIARALKVKWDLQLHGGVVIANPIPVEFEMDSGEINSAIDGALLEAQQAGISGKAITPFLLARISTLTGEASLRANIELVCHNARVGAELAGDFAALQSV